MAGSRSSGADVLSRLKSTKGWDIDPSLEGVRELCRLLGDPQLSYPTIQIAGTNGKSSVTRLVAALLRTAGLRTGMYTSPELLRVNERIELDGALISDAELAAALSEVFSCADAHALELTEFELMTVACFVALRKAAVDVGVLEVGLGGRWDATSVATPQVAVITGIGLDHQAILGDTLEKIAAEKAAIIKPDARAVVLGPLTAVTPSVERLIRERAQSCAVPVVAVRPPFTELEGLSWAGPAYQIPNIATALAAAEAFLAGEGVSGGPGSEPVRGKPAAGSPDSGPPGAPSRAQLQRVLDTVCFPGRFERISDDPPVICDGAHNPQAAAVLAETLHQLDLRPIVALGVFADKDYRGVIDALARVARDFIAIQPPTQRALPASELATEIAARTGRAPLATLASWDLDALCDTCEVTEDEPLLITGSLSLYALLQS
ncbi:MAG: Mur ligase family protein [Actinomycetia bacterium]|nr:Mur ligase family protein [Actinomycetes bacterium]